VKAYTSEAIRRFVTKPMFDEAVVMAGDGRWPRLSIVTPSFNQAAYLERTILSVLNQNYPNLQYIIVDGGSTDGSVEVIRKYEKYLAYWVSERDQGQGDAIDKGMRAADGEIVAWQNSDDVYVPDAFRTVGKIFEGRPDADLVFGNMYLIDERDGVRRDVRHVPVNHFALRYLTCCLSNQAAFWRRALMERCGGLDRGLRYCMDFELWLRMGRSAKYVFVREYLGAQRIHSESKTATILETFEKERREVRRRFDVTVPSARFFVGRCLAVARKGMLHGLQGDFDYIAVEVLRRIRAQLSGESYSWQVRN
jgi:glycosyltransferase involved in cell wall biosynthesis